MNIKGIEASGFVEAKGGKASKVTRLIASKGVFFKGGYRFRRKRFNYRGGYSLVYICVFL